MGGFATVLRNEEIRIQMGFQFMPCVDAYLITDTFLSFKSSLKTMVSRITSYEVPNKKKKYNHSKRKSCTHLAILINVKKGKRQMH